MRSCALSTEKPLTQLILSGQPRRTVPEGRITVLFFNSIFMEILTKLLLSALTLQRHPLNRI